MQTPSRSLARGDDRGVAAATAQSSPGSPTRDLVDNRKTDGGTGLSAARLSQVPALPAFHTGQGMFQSPSPSVPDSVGPTVLTTTTMSPRLTWS